MIWLLRFVSRRRSLAFSVADSVAWMVYCNIRALELSEGVA